MAWQIKFSKKSQKQFNKLPKEIKLRVKDLLYKKINNYSSPKSIGEALQGDLSGYWKYRVGKYRLIAEIKDEIITILILKIEKRETVYD